METPKEIFDFRYELYKDFNKGNSIPLSARPMIFACMVVYAEQESKQEAMDYLRWVRTRGYEESEYWKGEELSDEELYQLYRDKKDTNKSWPTADTNPGSIKIP